MGDFESDQRSLFALNLFFTAIGGNPIKGSEGDSINRLKYKALIFPHFEFKIIDDNKNKQVRKANPDFLFWKEGANFAIIIEVKGENSVEEEHLERLEKYSKIPLADIENRLRNELENPDIEIEEIFVGIVYLTETIEKCNQSETGNQRLNRLQSEFIVLHQRGGESLRVTNPVSLTFDPDLQGLLYTGISLPENPKVIIPIAEQPSIKGIIWAILERVIELFFSGETDVENKDKANTISFGAIELRDRIFGKFRTKLPNYRTALIYLKEKRLCESEDDETFNFKRATIENFIKNRENFKVELVNLDCEKYMIQTRKKNEKLDKFWAAKK